MLVAIPSKGRAGNVPSQKIISSAFLFVPELEVESYERLEGTNVIGVPDEVRGITKTRNWILDNTDDSWVVFVDDDVRKAGWIKMNAHASEVRTLTEDQFLAEWAKLFELTEEMGYRIWGTDTKGEPRAVHPYKPFVFHTYVTASCMGILNDGRTRFDESFPVKEDYELGLRCIMEDGGVVGARYLFWANSHWTDSGGCADYRTQRMEDETIARLMTMYPGYIRQVARRGSSYAIELDF